MAFLLSSSQHTTKTNSFVRHVLRSCRMVLRIIFCFPHRPGGGASLSGTYTCGKLFQMQNRMIFNTWRFFRAGRKNTKLGCMLSVSGGHWDVLVCKQEYRRPRKCTGQTIAFHECLPKVQDSSRKPCQDWPLLPRDFRTSKRSFWKATFTGCGDDIIIIVLKHGVSWLFCKMNKTPPNKLGKSSPA
jgi:hypothetical protein